jgi:hypothetical protein
MSRINVGVNFWNSTSYITNLISVDATLGSTCLSIFGALPIDFPEPPHSTLMTSWGLSQLPIYLVNRPLTLRLPHN